jgi:hypothetical protein
MIFYLLLPTPAPLQRGFKGIFVYLYFLSIPTHRVGELNHLIIKVFRGFEKPFCHPDFFRIYTLSALNHALDS